MNYFNKLSKIYLVAEIGVNHNGDINLAKKMIDAAKDSGADAVKFQTFSADNLVSHGTPKVKYQESTTDKDETHFELIKKLELSREAHYLLKEYSEKLDLDFISTPYDIDSAKFLLDLGVKLFKTASADIVDFPLHKFIANTGKPTIVSTGMATLGEIEDILNIYRFADNNNVILLHCVSNYPCSDKSLNLSVMDTMSKAFELPVGFSDHSIGDEAAILSVALNAKVIEKHFTLDKNLPGPDHKASSTPQEFYQLAFSVRRAEAMIGSKIKYCQKEEMQMRDVSRKSLTAVREIEKGEIITSEDIILKRPGTGLSYKEFKFIVGKKARKNIMKDTQISFLDLE